MRAEGARAMRVPFRRISTSAAERVPLRLASVVVSAWSFSAMEAEVTEARVGASSAPETETVKD